MPQMMPINWLIMTFLLFNILNYYIYNIKMNKNFMSNKKIIKNLNWKW
uniref:ATP synthase F0 subunit 8 n=1 Tax=Sitotroga cerealella TaxID=347735 RepID=A0A493QZY2_9NEOP|nr:ATP synthase F0 subunit 8 [Sitotroga cerealella]QAV57707.1 ATP synthase F0 subunit 8 [Sitotroga cerealella]